MLLDPARVAETKAWFTKAESDLRAAEYEFGATPPLLADIVFHCQQAAERSRRALFPTTTNPDTDHRVIGTLPTRRLLPTILLAWLTMLGFDFFLHAGLLARLYLDPNPFLLAPLEAFRRIPFGYLSFLLSAILLVWLMARLRLIGWRAGFGFGLKLGALIWGASTIGLFSISTADAFLLAGWFLGQTVELALGGAVTGEGLTGKHIGRLSLKVALLILFLAIITIVLQNSGLAPAVRIPLE